MRMKTDVADFSLLLICFLAAASALLFILFCVSIVAVAHVSIDWLDCIASIIDQREPATAIPGASSVSLTHYVSASSGHSQARDPSRWHVTSIPASPAADTSTASQSPELCLQAAQHRCRRTRPARIDLPTMSVLHRWGTRVPSHYSTRSHWPSQRPGGHPSTRAPELPRFLTTSTITTANQRNSMHARPPTTLSNPAGHPPSPTQKYPRHPYYTLLQYILLCMHAHANPPSERNTGCGCRPGGRKFFPAWIHPVSWQMGAMSAGGRVWCVWCVGRYRQRGGSTVGERRGGSLSARR
ncbi:hypothetical protein EDC01DRAFT_481655 [Geopyxis carbonaria]|nr:hypothetical protein EDC01DRAFT_481655 [Geopyxis carbonaria]